VLSLFKRYRELIVVAALLIYPFATLLARGSAERKPFVLDRAILGVTAPLQQGLTWAVDGVANGMHGYVGLRGAYREAVALRQENAELKGKVASVEETRLENERLRKLLAYAEDKPWMRIPARVIAVNPTSTLASFRINRGEQDGVRRGMPVVTPDGVVGQVLRATGGYADVLLINDVKSHIGVRVERSRARGTASGAGGGRALTLENDGALLLENVMRSDDLKEGDRLVTSGTDGIFPPGLVMGRAAAVHRKPTGMFLAAELLPEVDLNKVEEVFVLGTSTLNPSQGTSAQAVPGGTR
jgi:rod shape-determining protein MreC